MLLCSLYVIQPSVEVFTRLDSLVSKPFVIFIQVGIYIYETFWVHRLHFLTSNLYYPGTGALNLSVLQPWWLDFNFVVVILKRVKSLAGPKCIPSLKCNAWTRNVRNLYTVMGVTDLLNVEVCSALQMEVFQHCENTTCINVKKVHVCKIWHFHGGDYEKCCLLGYGAV
jgi:hypothetical protein